MYFLEVDRGSDEDDESNENPAEDGDAEKRFAHLNVYVSSWYMHIYEVQIISFDDFFT